MLEGPWPFLIIILVMIGLMTWGIIYTNRLEREDREFIESQRCQHEDSDYNSVTDEWVCRACGYRSTEVPGA